MCLLMIWKILTEQTKKKYITNLKAMDYFQKKRKDTTREQQEQVIYNIY